MSTELAHEAWARIANGPAAEGVTFPALPKILGSSVKIEKGSKKGILTAVAYLSPATEAGHRINMCPWATKECAAVCLGHSSGRLRMSTSKNARIWKTLLWKYERETFDLLLNREIESHRKKAEKKGLIAAIRLNGSTDVLQAKDYAMTHPEVQFYDYTKSFTRVVDNINGPKNVHLTFSYSGHNLPECLTVLKHGGNVATVFQELPETWHGYTVIDGDETDARFTDPAGTVCGLSYKGNVDTDEAGAFLVRLETAPEALQEKKNEA